MSVNAPQAGQSPAVWTDEPEIDLRKYIEALGRWRREIGIVTLAAILLAIGGIVVLNQVRTPLYEASADVAIVRTFSAVEFDERFRTESEAAAINPNTRRSGLLILALSPEIAQEVILRLGEQLDPGERNAYALLRNAEVSLSDPDSGRGGDSDLLRIKITAGSPEKAAALANAWANVFVQKANVVFGQVPDELFTSVQAELTNAEANYTVAQRNLEEFLATAHTDELTRLIAEQQALIDAYSAAGTASRLVVFNGEQENQRKALRQAIDAAQGVNSLVLEQQIARDKQYLASSYSTWITTTHALQAAESLRTQVVEGGDAAARSSVPALQLLKVKAFGAMPAGLQVSLSGNSDDVTATAMLQDLDGLIQAFQSRQSELEIAIDARIAEMQSGAAYSDLGTAPQSTGSLGQLSETALPALFTLSQLVQQSEDLAAAPPTDGTGTIAAALAAMQSNLRSLKAQQEAEASRHQQLVQRRDIAWEAYKALSNKATELNLTRAAANSEVRLATTAVAPAAPLGGPNPLLIAALAGALALAVMVLTALLADYLGEPPFFSRRRTAATLAYGGRTQREGVPPATS